MVAIELSPSAARPIPSSSVMLSIVSFFRVVLKTSYPLLLVQAPSKQIYVPFAYCFNFSLNTANSCTIEVAGSVKVEIVFLMTAVVCVPPCNVSEPTYAIPCPLFVRNIFCWWSRDGYSIDILSDAFLGTNVSRLSADITIPYSFASTNVLKTLLT